MIALLTDFGERDGFVGIMKGVMHHKLQAPVPMVDISHQIEPQNIRQGMWVLENAYRYFPTKTIFVAIIDPGVGSTEQASLLCYWPEREQAFIAPDNGLLTPIADAAGPALQCYDICQSELYQTDALSLYGRSQTFHGRDVYAPTAALMANAFLNSNATSFVSQFGSPMQSIQTLYTEPPSNLGTDNQMDLRGIIVAIDTFGNLITNIPTAWLPPPNVLLSISLQEQMPFLCPYVASYSVEFPSPIHSSPIVMVPSSSGTVELSIFQGSAQQFLQANLGHSIVIQAVP